MSTRHDMLVELVTDQINSIEQMIRDDEYDDVHHWLHPILLRKLKLDYADWSDDDLKNYYCDQLGVDIPEVPTLSSDDEETEELVKACFGQAPSQETANRGSLPLTEEQRFIHGAAADAQQVPEGMALYKGEFVTARMVVERLAKAESAYLSAWARLVKEERLHGYAMEERDHAMKIAAEGTSNAAYWHKRAMKAEARLAETLRSSIRGDIEAAYNGLDYLTSIHVATAADPNGGRNLARDAAEIKGRLLQHMKRIDADLTADPTNGAA